MTTDPLSSPFREAPCARLIVCCSDHRFAAAHRTLADLGAQRDADIAWLAIPGGPASLASADAPNAAGARAQAAFILQALKPAQVLLVAHDRCAFYEQVCNVPRDALESAQERDLAAAARWVMSMAPDAHVELRRMVVHADTVRAQPIEHAD